MSRSPFPPPLTHLDHTLRCAIIDWRNDAIIGGRAVAANPMLVHLSDEVQHLDALLLIAPLDDELPSSILSAIEEGLVQVLRALGDDQEPTHFERFDRA